MVIITMMTTIAMMMLVLMMVMLMVMMIVTMEIEAFMGVYHCMFIVQ